MSVAGAESRVHGCCSTTAARNLRDRGAVKTYTHTHGGEGVGSVKARAGGEEREEGRPGRGRRGRRRERGSVTASDAEANRREAGEGCKHWAPALRTRRTACIYVLCMCVCLGRPSLLRLAQGCVSPSWRLGALIYEMRPTCDRVQRARKTHRSLWRESSSYNARGPSDVYIEPDPFGRVSGCLVFITSGGRKTQAHTHTRHHE